MSILLNHFLSAFILFPAVYRSKYVFEPWKGCDNKINAKALWTGSQSTLSFLISKTFINAIKYPKTWKLNNRKKKKISTWGKHQQEFYSMLCFFFLLPTTQPLTILPEAPIIWFCALNMLYRIKFINFARNVFFPRKKKEDFCCMGIFPFRWRFVMVLFLFLSLLFVNSLSNFTLIQDASFNGIFFLKLFRRNIIASITLLS